MATPHTDRLHGIESWSTSSIQDSFGQFATVSSLLRTIADNNRKIVADLGMKGQTADAVCGYFDRVANDLYDQAEKIDQMSRVVKDVMDGGIEAKNHSVELQAKLAQVNQVFANAEAFGQSTPVGPEFMMQAKAKRDALHAEVDRQAKEVLHALNARTLNGIASLPYQDHIHQEMKSSNPALIERLERHEAAHGRQSALGDRYSEASPGGSPSGPVRSATAWHTPSREASLGGPGSHTDPALGHSSDGGVSGGLSLQGSRYTPPAQSGTILPGSNGLVQGGRVSAVHDHLAVAAALGGGTAALGYRAYQAARLALAAKAAPVSSSPARSGAALRSAPPARASGIMRGATTAARTPTPASSSGRSIRGGATGVARPASTAQARSILRGATTAQRAATPKPSPSRGSGILKGATTAVRKTTDSPASAGRPGSTTGSSRTNEASASRTNTASGSRAGARSRSASVGRGAETRSSSRGAAGSIRGSGARSASSSRNVSSSRSSASSRSLSSLTGRTSRRADDKRRDDQPSTERTPAVSRYEDDKTVTFLPAGKRDTANT